MLVVKSCVEILRSCGINNLVVVSDISAFCLDYKLPSTLNIELATLEACPGQWNSRNCLFSAVYQKRIATWKEVAVL